MGIGIAADPINKPGTKPADKITMTTDEEIKTALDKHQEIKASNLYDVIMSNKTLDQAGELGKAIKQAATDMNNNQVPVIKQYDESTQKKIAIDAGEYLGVLAMVKDVAEFPKKAAFLNFLKAPDFGNLSVIFPGEQNSPLGDSYGVQNAETGHNIVISSKGGKGSTASGAAPSLGGLRTSVDKRKAKIKPGNALDFINHIIQVLSKMSYQPVAIFRSNRISPVELAEVIFDLSERYNEATALIESNNYGNVVINELKHMGFKKFWYDEEGKDWLTTGKSKTFMFENLKTLIRNGYIRCIDNITFAEIRSLQVNEKGNIIIPDNLSSHGDNAVALSLASVCIEGVKLPRETYLPAWIKTGKAANVINKSGVAVANYRRY